MTITNQCLDEEQAPSVFLKSYLFLFYEHVACMYACAAHACLEFGWLGATMWVPGLLEEEDVLLSMGPLL